MDKNEQDIFWENLPQDIKDSIRQAYRADDCGSAKEALEKLCGKNLMTVAEEDRTTDDSPFPNPGDKVRMLKDPRIVKTVKTMTDYPMNRSLNNLTCEEDYETILVKDVIPYNRAPRFKEGDLVVVPDKDDIVFTVQSYEYNWVEHCYQYKMKDDLSLDWPYLETSLDPYPSDLKKPKYHPMQYVYANGNLVELYKVVLLNGRSVCGYVVLGDSTNPHNRTTCTERDIVPYVEPKFRKGDLIVTKDNNGERFIFTVSHLSYRLDSQTWFYETHELDITEFPEYSLEPYPEDLASPKFMYGNIVALRSESPVDRTPLRVRGVSFMMDHTKDRHVLIYHTVPASDEDQKPETHYEDELMTYRKPLLVGDLVEDGYKLCPITRIWDLNDNDRLFTIEGNAKVFSEKAFFDLLYTSEKEHKQRYLKEETTGLD